MKRSLLLGLVATGCATSQVFVPPDQAAALQRSIAGEARFMRVSFFGTPFYGDSTKRLLAPTPPEQLRQLFNPDGTAVSPGPKERTFPAGTAVRIVKLEFPTAYAMSERVLYTPRTLAWVYLDVSSLPKQSPPYVLVLRPGLKDENEVRTELDRYLSKDDPKPLLEGFSEAVRAAISEKKAIVEMPAEALEMAWGYPERKKFELEGTSKKETWFWPDGKRQAIVVDGKVTELK